MPPKAKKRRLKRSVEAASLSSSSSSSSSSGALPVDPAEIRKLSRWISRDKLEDLVIASVVDGEPLTAADLQNSLPENARWRFRPAAAEVKAGPQRVGTGLFDDVDDHAVAAIFEHLNIMERLVCATSVCKAWRDFKRSIPGLFVDLSDDSLGQVRQHELVLPGVRPYSERKEPKAKQVKALLEWIPEMSAVTGLRISTTDGCNPNECKQIIKMFADAKKKAGVDMDLITLVLEGPKIYASVLTEAIKNGIGPALTDLSFNKVRSVKAAKLGEGVIPELLQKCPRLARLRIMQSLIVERGSLLQHLRSLSLARSGSPTLLRVLDLTCSPGESDWGAERLHLSEVAKIGTLAPELEVLKLEIASGTPTFPAGETGETPANFLTEPMLFLPRLKEFCLQKIVKGHVWGGAPEYATTETIRRLLSWFLDAMPNVQDFTFGHGTSYMTNRESKMFSLPTLPGIGIADADLWPNTLKRLHLRELLLEPNCFNSVELPSIEKVTLTDCGPNALALVQGLQRAHNGLKVGVWKNGVGGISRTCLANALPEGFVEPGP